MNSQARGASRRTRGFTLIEIIVVISLIAILAGAMAPLAVRQARAGKLEATRMRMDNVLRAMVGEPADGDFGYLGEMGALPGSLADLNDPSGKPGYTIDPNDGVGYGYNGPYAPGAAAPGAALVDAWNRDFQYDGATAQLTSAGPDRAFGTPDDLVRPPNALATSGNLVVTVMGLPNTGGPAEQLDAGRADVLVGWSDNGSRNESTMLGGGPFTRNGLSIGLHGLRAEGSGTYSGAAAVRDVVTIRRGTTRATLVLVQP